MGILLAAFGGGLFGAAIGALPAFIFTGLAVLVAVGAGLGGASFDVLGLVAFGPVTGPHVTFAGGAAAAAFAARRGDIEDGKDIITPLAGLGDPLPLLVGGIFGAGGYALQVLLMNLLPPFQTAFYPTYIDVIAVVVTVSAIITRLAFGRTGLFGSLDAEAHERGRFSTGEGRVWLAYQEGFLQASVVGLGTGLLAAWAATQFTAFDPALLPFGVLLGYGISATALIFLQFGFSVPVTHHMTLPASVAAVGVTVAGGPQIIAILVGAVAGILGALLGELFSRLFLIHGDTHLDPPANAIIVMSVVIVLGTLLFA
ncbi:MAG: hypothetical protein H0T57_05400 [Rubrobacter sp.]|nr:hypothetical protein [Rubrobacter sp.]